MQKAKQKQKCRETQREIAKGKRDYKTAAEIKTYESKCDNRLLSTVVSKWGVIKS